MKKANKLLYKCVQVIVVTTFLTLPSCSPSNTVTIVWENDDGSTLKIDNVKKGSIPIYSNDGEVPTKQSDSEYDYSFLTWLPDVKKATCDTKYTAYYKKERKQPQLTFNYDSGFYDEPISLTLSSNKGYDIFYTLDNSDPTVNSNKYEMPIYINDCSTKPNHYSLIDTIAPYEVYHPTSLVDKCNIVKAIAVDRITGISTDIFTKVYFIGFNEKEGYDTLPIISIVANDNDLFGYEKGIYVKGRIFDEKSHEGDPPAWQANYKQRGIEWERKASFTYFDTSKKLCCSQELGIRIHGGWSSAFNQKSFNLYARNEYSGSNYFEYPFFNDIHAHSLMLRTGGFRDSYITKVRDVLNQDLSKHESFDTMSSEPCIVFLNGEYWGIYNFQERFSDNYLQEHHNVKNNSSIIIFDEGIIDEGREDLLDSITQVKQFLLTNDLSISDNYNKIKEYVDLEEFASYVATELYVGNIDWPINNLRMWRLDDKDAKWHFMMYDTDDSNGITDMCKKDSNPYLNSNHWAGGVLDVSCTIGLLFSKLIQNNSFKELYLNTVDRISNSNFNSDKVAKYLNDKESILTIPMVKHYQRFVSSDESVYDVEYFRNQINVIADFFQNRKGYFDYYTKEILG